MKALKLICTNLLELEKEIQKNKEKKQKDCLLVGLYMSHLLMYTPNLARATIILIDTLEELDVPSVERALKESAILKIKRLFNEKI